MMFVCPELEKLPGQEAILRGLTNPKTFNAGRYDQNGQSYNYFFQLFTRQRQTNYLHSNNLVKKLLASKAQTGTYQSNSALLSTSYGITLTDNSGTSGYSFYHNYTTPADHYSGLYWTVFSETGMIITKPVKSSTSINRGIVFDDQIISRTQNGLTSYHYQGETGYDYTISADVSRVTPATLDSTLKGIALNKYRSSTDIIEFTSGMDIQPVDYVQYLGNNYIVLSRKTGLNDYNIFTAVLESNNTYTLSGASINCRVAPAALIDVNTSAFGIIPSTSGNVQQLADWIDDNVYNPPTFWAREEQTSGTHGGTPTAGSYQKRTINTVKINTISGASLSSNNITLPAGTYHIKALSPFVATGRVKIKLYNVTNSADIIIGTAQYMTTGTLYGITADIIGQFTISAQKAIAIYYRCEVATVAYGLGVGSGWSDTEVFTEVYITKLY